MHIQTGVTTTSIVCTVITICLSAPYAIRRQFVATRQQDTRVEQPTDTETYDECWRKKRWTYIATSNLGAVSLKLIGGK